MRLTELPATLRGHVVTATTMSPGGVVALGAENGDIALVDSRRGTSPSAWYRGSGVERVFSLVVDLNRRAAVADQTVSLVVSKDAKRLLITTFEGRSWLADLVR